MVKLYVVEVLSANTTAAEDGRYECWSWFRLVSATSARAAHAAALAWAANQIENSPGLHQIVGVSNLVLVGRGQVEPLPGAFARRSLWVRSVWDRRTEIAPPLSTLAAVVFEENAPEGVEELLFSGDMTFDQQWLG